MTGAPAAIILAAGASSRFGAPKALAAWNGISFLQRAVTTARAMCDDRVLVVAGCYAFTQTDTAQTLVVINPQWRRGMGASIACGVDAARTHFPDAAQIIVMTVDQPLVTPGHLHALLAAAKAHGRCALTKSGEAVGPPAVLIESCFALATTLDGERGLKSVLPEYVTVTDVAALHDVDTPGDLAGLK